MGQTGDTGNVTQFLADANTKLLKLLNEANEAGWVLGTYITVDTQAISAGPTKPMSTHPPTTPSARRAFRPTQARPKSAASSPC